MAAKVRPCLVLSVAVEDADRSLVTLVPHTTSARGSRFEVSIATRFLKPGAFDVQGIVTVPMVRLVRRLGVLAPDQLAAVQGGVCRWLGIGLS
jgi:mRNA interferase MazF